jgi:hypothetical protein
MGKVAGFVVGEAQIRRKELIAKAANYVGRPLNIRFSVNCERFVANSFTIS